MKSVGHQTLRQLKMLLRGETNFSVWTLFSSLNFLIKNVVEKLQTQNYITSPQ